MIQSFVLSCSKLLDHNLFAGTLVFFIPPYTKSSLKFQHRWEISEDFLLELPPLECQSLFGILFWYKFHIRKGGSGDLPDHSMAIDMLAPIRDITRRRICRRMIMCVWLNFRSSTTGLQAQSDVLHKPKEPLTERTVSNLSHLLERYTSVYILQTTTVLEGRSFVCVFALYTFWSLIVELCI